MKIYLVMFPCLMYIFIIYMYFYIFLFYDTLTNESSKLMASDRWIEKI